MRFRRTVILLAMTLLAAACGQTIVIPAAPPGSASASGTAGALSAELTRPVAPTPLGLDVSTAIPAPGDVTLHEALVTADLHRALLDVSAGRTDGALANLDRAEAAARGPVDHWYISMTRAHALNLSGRVPEAEDAARRTAELETALVGSARVARALLGDAKIRLGDLDGARADYGWVLASLAGWSFPTSYSGKPKNMTALAVAAEAQTRALLGMTFAAAMAGDGAEVWRWGTATENLLADIMGVKAHGLYGSVIGEMHPDIFLARGVNMAFLGAAAIGREADPAAGEPWFDAARTYMAAIEFGAADTYIAALRAKGLLDGGFNDEAVDAADQAADFARLQGAEDFVWRTQAIAGLALAADGRDGEAEERLRRARGSVERIAGILRTDRSKRRFGAGKDDITHQLARIAYERGDAAGLFEALERGRSRAFVDLLAGVSIAGGDASAAMAAVRRLDADARVSIIGGESRGAGPGPSNLSDVLKDRDASVAALRRQAPRLAELVAVSATPLSDVQRGLGDGDLLVYAVPQADMAAPLRFLEITREDVRTVQVAATGADLCGLLEDLRVSVTERTVGGQYRAAQALGRALEIQRWGDASRVNVVPSGDLYFVPWGALSVSVPVVVLPTGDWLQRTGTPAADGPRSAVVVGDPEFHERLPQLAGARAEAREVGSLYAVAPLIGEQATESAVRGAVGAGTDLLHLATHGRFDPRRPLESALFLSDPASPGTLTARDLFEQPLPARIVVLSACETGIGRLDAGDDYLGLPRSFFLGGASAIMSSLWKVDDAGTALFMRVFHQNLQAGESAGQAWLRARNTVRDAGHPPWIFGAFVLSGSG